MVTADFCEEHASRGRFPQDIPRRRVLPFPPSRESVPPSMPYVYPALHNPKDSSQILFPHITETRPLKNVAREKWGTH